MLSGYLTHAVSSDDKRSPHVRYFCSLPIPCPSDMIYHDKCHEDDDDSGDSDDQGTADGGTARPGGMRCHMFHSLSPNIGSAAWLAWQKRKLAFVSQKLPHKASWPVSQGMHTVETESSCPIDLDPVKTLQGKCVSSFLCGRLKRIYISNRQVELLPAFISIHISHPCPTLACL